MPIRIDECLNPAPLRAIVQQWKATLSRTSGSGDQYSSAHQSALVSFRLPCFAHARKDPFRELAQCPGARHACVWSSRVARSFRLRRISEHARIFGPAQRSHATVRGVTGTSYTFNFVGAQPGRWRVSSVNGGGVAGPPSGWRQFRYTR
jgi:hypothetical protein